MPTSIQKDNPFISIREQYLDRAASGCASGVREQINAKSPHEATEFVMSLLDARNSKHYVSGDYVEKVVGDTSFSRGAGAINLTHTNLYAMDRDDAEMAIRRAINVSKSLSIQLMIGDSDKRGRVILEFEIMR